MKKTIVITGSNGFIFSNFLHIMVDKYSDKYRFVGIDKCVKNYNLINNFTHSNYKFYMADVSDQHLIDNIFKLEKPNYVIHGAAESFVDDSINDIKPFLSSNILGTQCMINSSLEFNIEKFLYVNTDEIYGSLNENELPWNEESKINPRNPYSASKMSGSLIVKAASETHGLKYLETRSSNNYGKLQPPRNLVPKIITCLLQNKKIPIHGSGINSREWLFVEDNCEAIMTVLEKSPMNETYNIGSGINKTNLEMVSEISKLLNINPEIEFIADRKGHDKKYAVDCSKLHNLRWKTKYAFEAGLKKCVEWYVNNKGYFNN